MRTTTRLAALTATAALVVTAAPAGAAPSPAPTTPAQTQVLPTLDSALGPQLTSLVEALRRDLGLTPEQFLDQAGIGERLAESRPRWEKAFRDSFGGVWLDEEGTGLVGVVAGEAGDLLRAEATDAGFTVQDVALTTEELSARERQVSKIVTDLPEDLRALVTGVRVDPTRNAVVVSTRGGEAAQLGNLTARLKDLAEVDMTEAPDPAWDTAPFGSEDGGTQSEGAPNTAGLEPATTRAGTPGPTLAGGDPGSLASLALLNQTGVIPEGPMRTVVELLAGLTPGTGSIIDGMSQTMSDPVTPVPQNQTRADGPAPTGPIAGGTAYSVAVPGGILECSTGFNGELDGSPVVITAAHCAGADGTRAALANGQEFGTMTRTQRDGIDTALVAVDPAFADRFRTNLVGAGPDTNQAITGTAAPVVGQKACKTGFRTGFSCGTVSEVGATIDVAGSRTIANAFTVDLCALPGDSGGVVFSGDKALGISSASNVAETGTCANADAVARENGYVPRLSAVPIADVMAAHPGLTLRTN
ncbi:MULTISPECIES: S1 family peptidase [unclassified Dietzia]|uniref:S1 family peptidase n=1 Tax=unclassified Dietzia TaxID=2617939 RepID=UPI0015FB6B40|nr:MULTISPECIES: S1 family peptidase [unclassified Dietzia]MBB1024170.1 trypsin-like peptidase domain-containing protein [Dietzia sp. DQ12-76]MBB1027579.1 trypsin-like peptidase domain-containing protein [Dietzia sp. DQ11-38-2]